MGNKKVNEICPVCEEPAVLRTLNSRPHASEGIMRTRRIMCTKCNATFTTHEVYFDPTIEVGYHAEARAFAQCVQKLYHEHFGEDDMRYALSKPSVATDSQAALIHGIGEGE